MAGEPSSLTAIFLLMTARHGLRVKGTVQGWGPTGPPSAQKLSRYVGRLAQFLCWFESLQRKRNFLLCCAFVPLLHLFHLIGKSFLLSHFLHMTNFFGSFPVDLYIISSKLLYPSPILHLPCSKLEVLRWYFLHCGFMALTSVSCSCSILYLFQ